MTNSSDTNFGDASQFYTGIVVDVYAPLRSSVPEPEPYARFIAGSGEPALELGCGTGDPLLDLRARGLNVEGLDASADMLAACRDAAADRGLDVVLHHQPMESMQLGRLFRSIFLAGPTFNLLPDDDATLQALTRIREHLDPEGSALIPLFVPPPTPERWIGRPREHTTADGRVLRVTTVEESRDDSQRRQTQVLRYEVVTGATTEMIERPWILHWYSQDEFRTIAHAAGLDTRAVIRADGTPSTPDDTAFVFVLSRYPDRA